MVFSFLSRNLKVQRRQTKGRRLGTEVSTPELLEVRELLTAGVGDTGVLPVLMVVADQRDFYYQEYGDTRTGLEAEGIEVQVAARTTNPTVPHAGTGEPAVTGGVVVPDIALADVDPSNYSAIVFVGGWGSSMYQYDFPGDYYDDWYDGDLTTKETVNSLITTFLEQDKYVTAICHGVTVLAWARVDGVSPLNGKQVSIPYIGSPGVYYNGQSYGYYQLGQYEQAIANGAIANVSSGAYGDPTTVADDVVVDGRIITAENYDAALAFGHRIGVEVWEALRVNAAPVLTVSGSAYLDSISVNHPEVLNTGTLVSDLIARMGPGGGIVDEDIGDGQGIAINGLVGNATGTWEYTIDGGASWSAIGTTGNSDARLLAADGNTRIRYVPNAGFKGLVKLAFVGWDQSEGVNGGIANVASRGGTTPFSALYDYASLTVTNSAPVLNASGNPMLDGILMNIGNDANLGTSVTDLIARMSPAGGISDVDPGSVQGIAINGLTGTANGAWEYTVNGGTNWSPIGTTGNSNARLLAADGNTRIRFVPNPGFKGEAKIAFVAWDRTSGANGGTANVASRGGTTAFSLAYEYARLIVSNAAPVLTPTGNATLDPIPANVPNGLNSGTLVTDLIECIGPAGSWSDANPGTIPGIAINGLGGTATGTWQYTINGGVSWSAIGTTGNSNARLLSANANTRIRYVPNAGFTGLVKLAFAIWDQSSGVNGGIANVASRGGSTPYSLQYDYASLVVG